jgi:hypothetical protein
MKNNFLEWMYGKTTKSMLFWCFCWLSSGGVVVQVGAASSSSSSVLKQSSSWVRPPQTLLCGTFLPLVIAGVGKATINKKEETTIVLEHMSSNAVTS